MVLLPLGFLSLSTSKDDVDAWNK